MDPSSWDTLAPVFSLMKLWNSATARALRIFADLFRSAQLRDIPPLLLCLIGTLGGISFLLLYSAGDGLSPWCIRQLGHFVIGTIMMVVTATVSVRIWAGFAYVFYALALSCLLLTTVLGVVGMGAQRWMNLGIVQFQPSELMRIALVLALARRFQDVPPKNFRSLIVPAVLVLIPVLVTLEQPDLGTAMLLLLSSGALFFCAGTHLRYFRWLLGIITVCLPILWQFLHDYQKNRVFTFLNPSRDPLGSGYHLIQSKIAIGSGGFWGKGWTQGTQSTLDFLPEKHTDFVFTLLCEEFGWIGAAFLLGLYVFYLFINGLMALHTKETFSRLTLAGMTFSFAFYVLINIAMVTGCLPVVGIPLPLISYGGTSMVTLLISQGIALSAALYRPRVRTIQGILRGEDEK